MGDTIPQSEEPETTVVASDIAAVDPAELAWSQAGTHSFHRAWGVGTPWPPLVAQRGNQPVS